ncbi:MAG: hypothetical protein JXN61_11420 [Sedimentisphaerales bacterium]|nr:hypothetical protein [Sedimentisphaerales bacterium]
MSEKRSELRDGRDNAGKLVGNGCPGVGTVHGLAGGVGGGVLGYFLFMVIAGQGFYAIVLQGALVGIGCGSLSGRKSTRLGIVCAILGLAAGILSEWRFAPFAEDESLSFFLTHLHKNSGVPLVLIGIGIICAFYFGRGREDGAWLRRRKKSDEKPNETT